MSPFKMNLNEIDRDHRNLNIPSFLPSLNEHKNAILLGSNYQPKEETKKSGF